VEEEEQPVLKKVSRRRKEAKNLIKGRK